MQLGAEPFMTYWHEPVSIFELLFERHVRDELCDQKCRLSLAWLGQPSAPA